MTLAERLPELAARADEHRRLVLVAPPGTGKSTLVAPALLKAGILDPAHPNLILLQPRRVAARAVAHRIAATNGWEVGREVGYLVRFERRVGPETRLRVATEGVLTRQMLADPFLEGVGAIVLDEFHERSIHSDLALALAREIQSTVREDLILVVMSATLEAEPVARFLGNDCPIVRVEGRTYPVEVAYQPSAEPLPLRVERAVAEEAARDRSGDILVFLPGAPEIRRSASALSSWGASSGWEILPLHGRLSSEDQDRALRPSGRRKVILATNVAETSLTIEGVGTVIDSGLAKFASFDPRRGLDRLALGRISKASADQRAGRAGRMGPGRCVRLWSPSEHRGLPDFDTPEVKRIDLSSTVLALHAFGHADAAAFGWYETPPGESIAAADALLERLGAWDPESRRITPLGQRMLKLPVHPRLARLLLAAADAGAPRHGAELAALLAEEDIRPPTASSSGQSGASDVLERLDLFRIAERARFAHDLRARGIDPAAARQVARARDDLLRQARRGSHGPEIEPDEDDLLRWILLAYPDRLARRRGPGDHSAVMVGGRGLWLDRSSVVRDADLFVAIEAREERFQGTLGAKVRVASAVRREWLDELFPAILKREVEIRFDPDREKVVGVAVDRFLDLILREEPHVAVDPGRAGIALAEALAPRAREWFAADEAASQWLARHEFLRSAMPEREWPEIADEDLAALLPDACAGARSLDEVRKAPLVPLLERGLAHDRRRTLRELAPESLTLPNGKVAPLSYEPGRPPVLAVRLQELFGWRETPRVAGGRVRVLLHILAPNFRPVQITEDLASFWSNTYAQVRKDLRGRYPKHAWPEDPRNAEPIVRPPRR